MQLNQLPTELGNGDAKDRWQDALGHVLEANQTLKKVQSAVDRDGVTCPRLVQILMEATICEQDFDSTAAFVDDKTWPQLFQHLRQADSTMERMMDAVKGYRLWPQPKILQMLRADRKDNLPENKDTGCGRGRGTLALQHRLRRRHSTTVSIRLTTVYCYGLSSGKNVTLGSRTMARIDCRF